MPSYASGSPGSPIIHVQAPHPPPKPAWEGLAMMGMLAVQFCVLALIAWKLVGPQESGSTADVVRAEIGFAARHARLVHDNYNGVMIRPTDKYLYVPLTRKGAKAGQTRDYKGVRMFKDYVLPGFPHGKKPVRLRPQRQAGYLLRHAKHFWALFNRLLERAA